MAEDLYDEFGNYIGPELASDQARSVRSSPIAEHAERCQHTMSMLYVYSVLYFDKMESGFFGTEPCTYAPRRRIMMRTLTWKMPSAGQTSACRLAMVGGCSMHMVHA